MRLTAAITREKDMYVARCLEVEVASHGASIEEALSALQEALELYFEDEPTAEVSAPPIIASVEVNAGPKSTAA
jgi:predicted RNase H-like HicB family nuclease